MVGALYAEEDIVLSAHYRHCPLYSSQISPLLSSMAEKELDTSTALTTPTRHEKFYFQQGTHVFQVSLYPPRFR